jgi:hypothetical protein
VSASTRLVILRRYNFVCLATSVSFFSCFLCTSHLEYAIMATIEKGQTTAVPDTERGQSAEMEQQQTDRVVKGDKVELQDSDAWDVLGYSFPTWRKW